MDLIQLYSSDEDENANKKIKLKNKLIPIKNLLNDNNIDNIDNIEINTKPIINKNGKKRQFPHVEGNWPSLIYIPCII